MRKNRVVTLQAHTNKDSLEEIQKLMDELGNTGHGIPFLVIFPANGGPPITFDGPITQQTVLDALKKAGPSRSVDGKLPLAEAGSMVPNGESKTKK